ncbi:MAG: MJ1255/VC2487 family glycosyltransferase [Plesiomonas shigelloides]|nr:MJ1255/VC2487 family glycosyltransferase [Plesiomonas shigelloides]
MKLLYGIQGTGNGHLSRARELVPALRAQGIRVDVLCSGRAADAYFDMQVFGAYQVRRGLSFITRAGRVDMLQTWQHNRLREFMRDVRALDVGSYDAVLSDFEPVSAWAARRAGVPSLSVSHQAAFLAPIPTEGDNAFNRLLMRQFAPVQHSVGLHWFHYNHPILPPIIATRCTDAVTDNGRVLVYLPFESLSDISAWLQQCPQTAFDCFHPEVKSEIVIKNIRLKPLSLHGFRRALTACHGVIANAGFELPSEAMVLGKKLLLKPLYGQFEQQSNVLALELLGLATRLFTLDTPSLLRWLASPAAGRVCFPDVAQAVAAWVAEGHWDFPARLSQQLWQAVRFPCGVAENVQSWLPDSSAVMTSPLSST